jgi:nucleoside 2-deoxyribosyltransferase
MKIYLAARYSRIDELNKYRDDLEEAGHWVTGRWLNGNHQLGDTYDPQDAIRFALDDLEDVDRADLLICFPDEPREEMPAPSRGGMHVELGYALGRGLRVMIVGPRQNVFHFLPWIDQFDTWEECLGSSQLDLAWAHVIPHG